MGWKRKVQDILMGNHPLGVPQTRRKVIDIAANVTLLVRDSGAIFTTYATASAADLVVTLPALADSIGCVYTIICTKDLNGLDVTSAEGNNIIGYDDVAASTVGFIEATDAANIGGGYTFMNDGTNWLCFVHLGDEGHSTAVT